MRWFLPNLNVRTEVRISKKMRNLKRKNIRKISNKSIERIESDIRKKTVAVMKKKQERKNFIYQLPFCSSVKNEESSGTVKERLSSDSAWSG